MGSKIKIDEIELENYTKRKREEVENAKMLEKGKGFVESILNYLHGEKYRCPRDENERGFNRGVERCIKSIKESFTL